ncbi:TIM barrel protein [Microbacterium soli]|uniref:TIM barrel protein n=2 Tax=Microbacterium soli TaxID=446075 RepID=A0ABP7N7D5_9MICO
MLYASMDRDERPGAAAADGYRFVESWWPFRGPAAEPAELESFCSGLDRAGVRLVALNLDAGDVAHGDRGLLSIPTHHERVVANLDSVAEILARTGCRTVNALYGNRAPAFDPEQQDRLALEQIVAVADRLGENGATVVVETLNSVDSPAFPLTDIGDSAAFVRRANELGRYRNVRLLLDTYHLAAMGVDPSHAVREYGALIGHVQFADFPGRGRPGTGRVDFAAVETQLTAIAYRGYIAFEFDPAVTSEQGEEGFA